MVALRLIPADEARYKFCNGQWQISGRAEPHYGAGLFFHPDGVNTGKHWMEERTVSFHRVKLTNNSKENSPTNVIYYLYHYIIIHKCFIGFEITIYMNSGCGEIGCQFVFIAYGVTEMYSSKPTLESVFTHA